MGYFRFRRSIRILPDIRLNVSKTGSSVSFGQQGFTANVSRRGIKNTISIPGSGFSYSWQEKRKLSRGLVILFSAVAIVWYLLRHL
jgi:hypothetical protein